MIEVVAKKCKNYDIKKIKQIFFDIFSSSNFISKLSSLNSVLLKPNLLGPYPPEKGVTTHPIFIAALVELLKDYNIEISLFDNPGGNVKYNEVLQKCGILNLSKKYNIEILEPVKSGIYKFGEKPEYIINKPFLDCQAIINLPKLKTHTLTLFTGAIKNMYGIVPGLAKSNYHRIAPHPTKFAEIVVDIYSLVKDKIIFNLMDGIIGMDGNGPSSGDSKNFGVILGSPEAIALDFCASKMMGYNPKKIPTIMFAAERYGISHQEIQLQGDFKETYKLENVNIRKSKNTNKIIRLFSHPFKRFIRKFFWAYPDFLPDKCSKCGNCVKSCPVSALAIIKESPIPQLDRDKCTLCLCCIEMCSENAVFLKKSFLGKFLIK
ncbi:MAG: DUF362 domain-containing protein [Candidatus Cloacimonetes bacterium]|nr:DUF362 domain-containing protein [Candidatus Cloacimonadota bacterium]MBL7086294.1 DUF362 domain-containing protein [Candidatus Cloacimonadota bacterium]